MHLDVSELRDFYARPLGQTVRRLLAHRLRARWRRMDGGTLVGLGFTTPYLGAFRGEAYRVGALMPADQGALAWPNTERGPCQTVLVDEHHLPLPDNSVDRLLVVHCLETVEGVRPFLRELWRVMAPEGRLLMIVPNRRGVWARLEATPFGHGRPFSRSQLERMLGEALLTPLDVSWALHMPPIERAMVLRSAVTCERIGARVAHALGGVVIVEARKEIIMPPRGTRVPASIRALGGLVTVRPRAAHRNFAASGQATSAPVTSLSEETQPSRQTGSASGSSA